MFSSPAPVLPAFYVLALDAAGTAYEWNEFHCESADAVLDVLEGTLGLEPIYLRVVLVEEDESGWYTDERVAEHVAAQRAEASLDAQDLLDASEDGCGPDCDLEGLALLLDEGCPCVRSLAWPLGPNEQEEANVAFLQALATVPGLEAAAATLLAHLEEEGYGTVGSV